MAYNFQQLRFYFLFTITFLLHVDARNVMRPDKTRGACYSCGIPANYAQRVLKCPPTARMHAVSRVHRPEN